MAKTILVTGAAGFIGSHVTQALLERGDRVIGVDNLNDYYSPAQKRGNLDEVRSQSARWENFTFLEADLRDRDSVRQFMAGHAFDAIVHLAGMAGVRIRSSSPTSISASISKAR